MWWLAQLNLQELPVVKYISAELNLAVQAPTAKLPNLIHHYYLHLYSSACFHLQYKNRKSDYGPSCVERTIMCNE